MKKFLALILVSLMIPFAFSSCEYDISISKKTDKDNNQSNEDSIKDWWNSILDNDSNVNETLPPISDFTDKPSKPENTENPLAGTYNIKMWVPEKEGVDDQIKEQIADFMKKNPGIIIQADISGVNEANAGSLVVADPASAADIYCFTQDQLARLVQAAVLAKPGTTATEAIKANNDASSVAAATIAGTVYAYPMTSDSGYYMYYDKSIITDPENLEQIIEDCEKNNVKIRYGLENPWYAVSFFFATGCHSNWFMNDAGEFIGIDDNFNSENGLIAMRAMQKLAQSTAYESNPDIFNDAGVIITSVWNEQAAADHFGENLAATDLPSFTVDGKTYHLGSFSTNKLMGVKPQTDAKKGVVLSLLAQYLTGEKCQQARFESFKWAPSNKAVQASEAVQSNISYAALAKQNAYATPQREIGNTWWDIAKILGARAKNAKTDADLQNALYSYEMEINCWLNIPPEKREAWTVIGNIGNTHWDTDFEMVEDPRGTWITKNVIEMKAGQEYKVRKGLSWDNNYGANGEFNGNNYIVEADGKYKVKLVLGDKVTIELIPASA